MRIWAPNAECLADVPKCLVLLAFVSYEAVRLWWWRGTSGVMGFEKSDIPVRFRPSPPTLNRFVFNGLPVAVPVKK